MERPELDPLVQRAMADAVLERAAAELRPILQRLATAFRPFPQFQGMATIQALEITPSGPSEPERGCIVLCPDGELYELVLTPIPGIAGLEGGLDHVEEYREPELPPGDYVAYLSAAIHQVTRLLQERRQGRANTPH